MKMRGRNRRNGPTSEITPLMRSAELQLQRIAEVSFRKRNREIGLIVTIKVATVVPKCSSDRTGPGEAPHTPPAAVVRITTDA